jgi:glycosyltransferase involved in cell wall biosynthesis
VVAISDAVRRHLADDLGVAQRKIYLIESGIDLEAFVPADEQQKRERRQRFHLGEEPVLGMIARLSDVKGQDVLIEAMRKIVGAVSNVTLLLVGEGRMEARLRKRVGRLHLQDHVRFISVVNKTQEMLSLFDVFVVPSRQEGLGLSIMEAQAMGLPVVASRVGGIPSLIEDGKTGVLVEPGKSDLLAEAIIGLLRDKGRSKTIGAAGRTFIQENYSSEKMIDKITALYEQCITRNNEKYSCCQR